MSQAVRYMFYEILCLSALREYRLRILLLVLRLLLENLIKSPADEVDDVDVLPLVVIVQCIKPFI